MKVIISGASGFVGSAVAGECAARRIAFVPLVSHRCNSTAGILADARRIDIADRVEVAGLEDLKCCDAIVHTAGLAHQFKKTADEKFWQVNVCGTENIAELGVRLKIKHFVLISSVSVYGTTENYSPTDFSGENSLRTGINESALTRPTDVYARSKLRAEEAAREICEKNGIRLTILRLATVIGEGDCGNVRRLIETIDRRRFFWIGRGENYKSLIYRGDVAHGCLTILEQPPKETETEIYNLTAEPLPMKCIVSKIADHLQVRNPSLFVPEFVLNAAEKMFVANRRFGLSDKIEKTALTVRKWLADDVYSGAKIEREKGFRTQTDIGEALRLEIEIYRQNKQNN